MKVPIIHCTDLYYPHSDFDDVGDIFTMFGLHVMGEIELLSVVLDQPAEQELRPGSVTVNALNKITGLNVQCVTGYHSMLAELNKVKTQAVVTIVGSLTDLYWCYKMNPSLCRSKIKEVWVFAGDAQEHALRGHMEGKSVAPPYGLEHNVATDPEAFREIMRSDLKIVWIPCYDGGEVVDEKGVPKYQVGVNQTRGSYLLAQYDQLLSKSSTEVRDLFLWALSAERTEGGLYDWNIVKHHHKEFWGIGLFRAIAKPELSYPFKFFNTNIQVNDNATVKVGVGNKQVMMFEKTDKANYYARMTSLTADVFANIKRYSAPPVITGTPLVAPTQASAAQAQEWARSKKAHQRFINIAPLYWETGAATGINPEILYAQSAKETAFGHYTGVVPHTYNNWAGIKTREATGDKPWDHQQFPTPQEGVRAHFNHISAYVGLPPVGEPHGRYHLVMTLSWAGSIKYAEELSGKWAPSSTYAEELLFNSTQIISEPPFVPPTVPPDGCPNGCQVIIDELIEELQLVAIQHDKAEIAIFDLEQKILAAKAALE